MTTSSIVVLVDGPCFEYPEVLKSLNRVLDGTPKVRVSDYLDCAQSSRRRGRLSGWSIGLGRLRTHLVFHSFKLTRPRKTQPVRRSIHLGN
jgi:hypothetical protein